MKRMPLIIVVLLMGVLAGMAVQHYGFMSGDKGAAMGSAQSGADKEVVFYRHPMNPSITSDKPAKDEMGMDYIPVYKDGGQTGADDGSVTISPAIVNNMGVRTARVEQGALARRIDSVGYIGYDEERVHHVHLRTEGWVERLNVKFVGDRVKQGELLFELYSPKLVTAQEEYLQALETGNKGLINASRTRLRALGVADEQIAKLGQTRKVDQLVKSYAHQDGVVRDLNIREGMFVEPATEAVSLVDLSSVWILADVFEQQAEWVAVGQQAEVRLPYLPGKVWKGVVDYIYPSLDPTTRTLKVRLQFANPEEMLKPNMYADITIFAGEKSGALSIPREALIRTGQEQRVIMALGDGKFAPRAVRPGMESGERVEITEGLKEGEQVVVSGQFLIDSESNLRASLTRMTPVDTQAAQQSVEKIARGVGVVNTVADDKVNISHGPIAALNWPAMTMDFKWSDPAQAARIKPGDSVEFEFKEGAGGQYLVTKITPKAAP